MKTPSKGRADTLSIVVVGASGDLAQRKVFPALFALFCQKQLPARFALFGFARSPFTHEAFRARIRENLTCRYVPGDSCAGKMSEFLSRCFYVSGQYAASDSYLDLYAAMRDVEEGAANRLFYLAIPPTVFLDVARALGDSGLVECGHREPWSRVVIEKPFGRDRESSDMLTREMSKVFSEDQTFRIDHYLGKEVVQNLLVLRFANLVFEPIWNRRFVKNIEITWKEDLDVQGRAGYFDSFGIIRDVMQNHLLQILSLVAMERPRSSSANAIRNEKVKVLKSIAPMTLDDVVVGQYSGSQRDGRALPGYTDDPAVPKDSITPTFAATVLRIRNRRWEGVPFLMRAGKGLDQRLTEIRIRFREVSGNIFCAGSSCPDANEFVVRVQPDEAIDFKIVNKVPGLDMTLAARNLDLRYKAAFSQEIPDAYESLLVDVIRGEKGLFIRGDELAAAWDVFTPVLHELEARHVRPAPYAQGSRGPAGADELAARYGARRV